MNVITQPAIMWQAPDCPIWDQAEFLSPLECQKLIAVHGHDLETSRTSGSDDLRISSQRFFEDEELINKVAELVRSYADWRNIDIGNGHKFESPCIIKYEAGGKYDFHMDNQMSHPEDRKIAVVITLNEDFAGGGTEWLWPYPARPAYLPPHTGNIVMFPSILLHRGMPVISGERWIIVTWALGPPWR